MCFGSRQLINQLQLGAADLKRAQKPEEAQRAWEEMEVEEKKFDAHLQEDIDMRRQLLSFVDLGKALRSHNLRTGVYDAASVPLPPPPAVAAAAAVDAAVPPPTLTTTTTELAAATATDAATDTATAAITDTAAAVDAAARPPPAHAATMELDAAADYDDADIRAPACAPAKTDGHAFTAASRSKRYVPFNTVPGVRLFHIDDKSAAELPNPKKACVGDDRGLFTVQINGQHDAITDVQINYLSHGAGSKDADKLIDEIIANIAEQLQGEMVVVLVFDNCAVGKNAEISTKLPQLIVDRGLAAVCEMWYLVKYHGKWLSDARFGGYEQTIKQHDVFYLDCLGLAIEGRLDAKEGEVTEVAGLDFARVTDPIKQTNYDKYLEAQYNTITDSKYDFGFTRRELHHFVSMSEGALERIKTAAFEAPLPDGATLRVSGDELVERYRRFRKGAGWIGCATKDVNAPVVFFLMHKRRGEAAVEALKPQFKTSEQTRVKVDTLTKIGFNASNASLNSRAQHAARLDVAGAGPKELDQRNAPIVPVSEKPHRPPEWFAFASLGIAPAACQGNPLPSGWSAHARSPPLMPLPMEPTVVRDGPRPSAWAAMRRLAALKREPSTWVSMADVLRSLVAEVARGPAEARGAYSTLDAMPVAEPKDTAEFEKLVQGWKAEGIAFRNSDEYKEAKAKQLKAQELAKAAAQESAAQKMAVEAEVAQRHASETPKLSREERKQQLDVLLGKGPGGIQSLNVANLKQMLEEEYGEVCSGKHPTMADVKKPALVAKLEQHVRAELQRVDAELNGETTNSPAPAAAAAWRSS